MPIFPKIQSPCPYKSEVAAALDGEYCRICERTVFDLSAMNDGERLAFLAGCEEEVCVSYRVPLRPGIAAAALAAAAMSVPAAAQEVPAPVQDVGSPDAGLPVETASPEEDYAMDIGGIKDPRNVELVEIGSDGALPELPVVYDDEVESAKPGARPAVSGPGGV
ncbi:MAG TPA: hypothetical protein VF619_00805 [Allosphingosinicella sp.]|jgi:predicted Fe-S protein YdhL (DUF1289 family)